VNARPTSVVAAANARWQRTTREEDRDGMPGGELAPDRAAGLPSSACSTGTTSRDSSLDARARGVQQPASVSQKV
jgi:hypothetical protein